MIASARTYLGAAVLLAGFNTVPAWSATVTVLSGGPAGGTAVDLKVSDFERLGNCGGGGSVVNDGCSVVVKSDRLAPHASGRFDPPPQNYWIDSADIDKLKWTVNSSTPFTSLAFALTDAHDQKNSHFSMSFNDDGKWTSIWDIPSRLPNSNLFWLMVDFGKEVTSADLMFSTRLNDGYGISDVTIDSPAPVPVPSAALMLMSGAAFLSFFRRRNKAA
ncbi:hypothetical protein [Paracoccus beibuensis]|uniref:hypothetical protein n=1 Tax=Paracoccus beibuensis TaxID=547602 RepID=UPI00223F741A|nr:hypothetical protein [Paracoccus beibuensis]